MRGRRLARFDDGGEDIETMTIDEIRRRWRRDREATSGTGKATSRIGESRARCFFLTINDSLPPLPPQTNCATNKGLKEYLSSKSDLVSKSDLGAK
ncbi:unnamed protein product [Linum trigynum]|uniref:Uncharacterized protein n=1 Tax=Linum trigynum TaxID=586398 RepID=A0AAV2FUB1_9ROSI